MKKSIILILSLPLILASCGGGSTSDDKTPEVKVHMTSKAGYYVLASTEAGLEFKKAFELDVDTFNESLIPYAEVQTAYINFQSKAPVITGVVGTDYTHELNGKVYTITNVANSSTAKIDVSKQTVTFSDYHAFKNPMAQQYNSFDLGQSSANVFKSTKDDFKMSKAAELTIDFSKYNIKIYLDNSKIYLPYDILQNIFFSTGMNFGYNGKDFYTYSFNSKQSEAEKKLFEQASGDRELYKNADYMEYTYNLLAMTLDTQFGMRERKLRSDNMKQSYFLKDGAYSVLSPYKSALISSEMNKSQEALNSVFTTCLDDGGHSACFSVNYLTDGTKEFKQTGNEYDVTSKYITGISNARASSAYSHAAITGNPYAAASYQEKDGVAFVAFDEFNGNAFHDYSKDVIDSSNYFQSTITLVHYANEQIRNNNIKKVVIDLASNGGGAILSENFISSWAAGGSKFVSKDILTGSVSQINNKADVNFDGKYDENDYLPSDVEVYCLISPGSFSCASLMPTTLKACSNCKFMGARFGGGGCAVRNKMSTGLGSTYNLSSTQQLGSLDSNDNFVCDDDGFEVDFYKVDLSSETAFAQFIDRDEQIKAIKGLK